MNAEIRGRAEKVLLTAIKSEARRMTTLQLLGIIAVAMGLLIVLTRNPGTSLQLFAMLPGWPGLAGSLLSLFGLVLLAGTLTSHPKTAFTGAVLCFTWYVFFGFGFGVQWFVWTYAHHPFEMEPPLYPIASYLGLAALHCLNARAIREHLGDTDL